jgi:hypothetical protein
LMSCVVFTQSMLYENICQQHKVAGLPAISIYNLIADLKLDTTTPGNKTFSEVFSESRMKKLKSKIIAFSNFNSASKNIVQVLEIPLGIMKNIAPMIDQALKKRKDFLKQYENLTHFSDANVNYIYSAILKIKELELDTSKSRFSLTSEPKVLYIQAKKKDPCGDAPYLSALPCTYRLIL